MRWEALFADLEAQLAAGDVDAAMEADLVRAEIADVHLVDRLRAAAGVVVRVRLVNGATVTGEVADVGADWALLHQESTRALLPISAVAAMSGLPRAVAPPAGVVERRLRLSMALRALARERAAVLLDLWGHRIHGTIDRVAADHLEIAEHPVGEARRERAVSDRITVPLSALVSVRSS